MKKSSLISVIIPVYNVEKYIEECITSILNQTYKNLEIIIINDGSTDKSLEKLKKFNDSRIILKTKENGGVSSARNYGLNLATGDFVSFIDSDDTLVDSAYEKMLEYAASSDVICCNWNQWFEEVKIKCGFNKHVAMNSVEGMNELIKSTNSFSGYLWNKLFKLNIVKKYNLRFIEEISICEDLLFCFDYFEKCKKITTITDNLYNYRMRIGAVSKKFNLKKFYTIFNAYDKIFVKCEEYLLTNKVNIQYEYLFNYFLYKKILDKNNVSFASNLDDMYRNVLNSKNIKLSKKLEIFSIKNLLIFYKLFNRVKGYFSRKYTMFK